MANVYGADPALTSQQLTLLTSSRALVRSQVVDITSSAFDHVVRSTADLPTPVAGIITLTTGSWAFAAAINLGADQILVPAGTTVFVKGMGWDKILTTTGDALTVQGTAVIEDLAISAGNQGVVLSNVAAEAYLLDCWIDAIGACVRISSANRVSVQGGLWTGAGTGYGLRTSGNTTLGILLANLQAANLADFVHRSSGTAASVVIQGCTADTNTNGILWASASVPTQGMAIVANALSAPTPFSGFTVASAGFNAKANLGAAGLLSETPIVP